LSAGEAEEDRKARARAEAREKKRLLDEERRKDIQKEMDRRRGTPGRPIFSSLLESNNTSLLG